MANPALKPGSTHSNKTTKTPADQRVHSRIGYKQVQRIAPLTNGKLPRYDAFVPVKCNDVSRGGLSFFADDEPTYTELVVEIVARDVTRYLLARVSNVRRDPKKNVVIIGCRFGDQVPTPQGAPVAKSH